MISSHITIYNSTNQAIAFLILSFFAITRPLLTIEIFNKYSIFELYGILISYLLLFALFLNIKRLKFDAITVLLLIFSGYIASSLLWGSEPKQTVRLLLPFVVFFTVKIGVQSEHQVKKLLFLFVLSFIIPIIGSSILIILDKSVDMTIYWTGLQRYKGMYLKIHTMAHSMYIFLITFSLYIYFRYKESHKISKFFLISVMLLTTLSLFNLYKTYTRTVFIGLSITLLFLLVGQKRYKLLLLSLIAGILVIGTSQFKTIFFDLIEPLSGKRDIDLTAGGRIGIWKEGYSIFMNYFISQKLFGVGIGNELGVKDDFFGASHSDIISLLLSLGIIGFFLYFAILAIFFFDVISSKIDPFLKYFFIGFIISVILMNFASNSYLIRFELGQYFFLFLGIFYYIRESVASCNPKSVSQFSNF